MKLTDNKHSIGIVKLLLDEKISTNAVLSCLEIGLSTLYKHISQLKKAGFHIKKENDFYELLTYRKYLKFVDYELSILCYLLLLVDVMLPKKKFALFSGAVEKMLCLGNKKDSKKVFEKYDEYKKAIIGEYYSEKVSLLKKHLDDKTPVKIMIKDIEELNVIPKEFYWEKDKLIMKYSDEQDELKTVLLDDVVKVIENQEKIEFSDNCETIFEIRGKLAKSYLLKEEERVIDCFRDKIIIANSQKDKDKLFRRLLRYDIYCKVIFPKTDVKKFKLLLEKSLENILKFSDNI